VDPRRRTYAAGLYTHVRDRWGLFYDQPIVLNERQAGVAVEGVEQHNRAEDRIRISLLAVDTHGVTNVAMAIAKLLGFDLCPRLRDLRERKLFVPRGWPVPESLEGVTVRRVSIKAIERGGTTWCAWLRRFGRARCLPRMPSTGWVRQRSAIHCTTLRNTLDACCERCSGATTWPSRTIGERSTRCSTGGSQCTNCSAPFMAASWPQSVAVVGRRWRRSRARTRF